MVDRLYTTWVLRGVVPGVGGLTGGRPVPNDDRLLQTEGLTVHTGLRLS